MTVSDILHKIDPVDPESIVPLGDGLYVARWCPPVPMMDLEVLRRTAGIEVVGEPFEPDGLPGWMAVRFRLRA
ncbi:MAG TPA: hypothetical protein VJ793_22450 [Anaerolineae bacterium]|nr:hypothetical protein [Anaerolineae bacterium]